MTTEESSYRLPNNTLWEHVAKIAIVEDRPIMLDYWVDSLDKKALIGVRENGEKFDMGDKFGFGIWEKIVIDFNKQNVDKSESSKTKSSERSRQYFC